MCIRYHDVCRFVCVHYQDADDAPSVRVPRRHRLLRLHLPALDLPHRHLPAYGEVVSSVRAAVSRSEMRRSSAYR